MEVPATLLKASFMTRTQLESLLMYQKVQSRDMTLRQAAEMRVPNPVKIGSYYRTVQQGRRNIRTAVITMTLALWMGFIRSDELRRLLDVVGKGVPQLEEADREQLEGVIMALVEHIVM